MFSSVTQQQCLQTPILCKKLFHLSAALEMELKICAILSCSFDGTVDTAVCNCG